MTGLERLLTFPRFGAPGVNERMTELVSGLEMVPTIKVVGSNGKGTTAHMMAQMAQGLGKKVGLYTSPHLLRVGERIQVNGREVTERDLNYLLNWAINRVGDMKDVGRFEILTLAAIYHFAQSAVDLAIMEVGLGGRYDPVRVARGHLSVLTSIDLEHTAILGDTIEQIAAEKAAVCQAGDTLISAVGGIEECMPEGVEYLDLSEPPLAPLQSNARLAAFALERHFKLGHLPEAHNFRIPGRLQKISAHPPIYVDVAHNPQAVRTVLDLLGDRPINLIIAARNDKDIDHMPDDFNHVIALQFDEDMYPAQAILDAFDCAQKNTAENIENALEIAQETLPENGIILCLGGFGLVGRVLAHTEGVHYDVISL